MLPWVLIVIGIFSLVSIELLNRMIVKATFRIGVLKGYMYSKYPDEPLYADAKPIIDDLMKIVEEAENREEESDGEQT